MPDFDFHPDDLNYNPTDVDVRRQTFTIDMILRMIDQGRIELTRRPNYQRKATKWSGERRSRLIESLLMRIPLPIFYFDGSNELWQVIDGIHRLTAFHGFFKNEFRLENLQYFKELDGLLFRELPFRYQRVIEESTIEAYLINPGTPEEVKYNIFQRINIGGTPLTAQEIRNAFYLKEANDFLNQLVDSEAFKTVTRNKISADRGRAQEVILRCVALYEYFERYEPPMQIFLDRAIKSLDLLPLSNKLDLQDRFENAFRISYELFENRAFQILNRDGESMSSQINIALLEGWVVNIARLEHADAERLIHRRNKVFHLHIELLQNAEFNKTIVSATTSKRAVAIRQEMISILIQNILHVN